MTAVRMGVVAGVLVYAGAVVLLIAGFTPIAPFVVVPPVLIGLIAAGVLLGNGQHGRRPPGGARAPGAGPDGGAPHDPGGGAP